MISICNKSGRTGGTMRCCCFLLRHSPSQFRCLWSMKKDPELESALSRNRRWIVNNQIKHWLLRFPSHSAPVNSLQRRFKTLGLRGKALNWLRKYPSCFHVFPSPDGDQDEDRLHFTLSKPMAALALEESSVVESQEPAMADRLAKLLMLSRDRRLPLLKLNEFKRNLGLPDDFLLRLSADRFRVVSNGGRRTSTELELVRWEDDLAVSSVEAAAISRGTEPRFACSLPESWVRSRERFEEFNLGSPYVSPYSSREIESEKRAVGMVHELLSLTLWKKASIMKLGHFGREFALPNKLNLLLLRHPCIFYVSNRYKIYTVLLREAYRGSDLLEKDPLVLIKAKFGELMQEGLHEYNQRRRQFNLEKRKGVIVAARPPKKMAGVDEDDDDDDEEDADSTRVSDVLKLEERRRFYRALFDENAP